MMRRADIWFPFTPTFTAARFQAGSWRDALRYVLSGIFLILLPAAYFTGVLVVLTKEPAPFVIHFTPPALLDITKFVVVMSLVAPQLGFYDLWQAIMRASPDWFYSNHAKTEIRTHYADAFKPGRAAAAVAWGFGWIFIPTLAFIYILWIQKT